LIGGKVITTIGNFLTTVDRFGNADSALLYNHGFASLPEGVFFELNKEGFTIMFWVKIMSMTNEWPQLLSFNIEQDNYMDFGFFACTSRLYFRSELYGLDFVTNEAVAFNTWTHVAICVNYTEASAYFNGLIVSFSDSTEEILNRLAELKNRIQTVNLELDDLKLYDGPTHVNEIISEMIREGELMGDTEDNSNEKK
jgi:hypothetical protein